MVKKHFSAHVYLFGDEVLDDLGGDDCNGTAASTSSGISKLDTWFCFFSSGDLQLSSKQTLQPVYELMLALDNSLPPFIQVCILNENDRGVVLAHFLSGAIKKNGNDLKANSKGLLMTAFQRAFRAFDAKHGINNLSTMTGWRNTLHTSTIRNNV